MSTQQNLLITLMNIEQKIQQLDKQGIKFLGLEHIQIDVLHAIAELKRIKRNDEGLDYLFAPVFDYLHGDMKLGECMFQLNSRACEIKKERDKMR